MMMFQSLPSLKHLLIFSFLATSALSQDHGEEAAKEMGPVAFMWPADREWGAAQDNTAPCGSSQGIANRTEFPLGVWSDATNRDS